MSGALPDWTDGDEGRIVCERCAVEMVAVRLGVFRFPACGSDDESTDIVVAGPAEQWGTINIAAVLRRGRVIPRLGLG